ncbi:hypothetical protein EJB05_05768 [Eragrostis curvula]|uniref:Uncharacterized protein n=1 Tax=Eragrostis curvula TaxID=38414 RepID=A0A5J9WDY8_9POAL|nr:hypothetical protein EJB05_05768 [Eragrostis curvula]
MDTQVIEDMFCFANSGCVLLIVLCFQQCGRNEDAGAMELRGGAMEHASLAQCGRRCGRPLRQVVAALWMVAMAAAAQNKNEISLLDIAAAIIHMEIQALDSMMHKPACGTTSRSCCCLTGVLIYDMGKMTGFLSAMQPDREEAGNRKKIHSHR